MSSPARTRPSTVALTAIAIGAIVLLAVVIAVVVGVDLIKYGETFVTGLYPPQAVTEQGGAIRDLSRSCSSSRSPSSSSSRA